MGEWRPQAERRLPCGPVRTSSQAFAPGLDSWATLAPFQEQFQDRVTGEELRGDGHLFQPVQKCVTQDHHYTLAAQTNDFCFA